MEILLEKMDKRLIDTVSIFLISSEHRSVWKAR